ncbi:rod shape-determining protein MreD [Dongshaea marina]|uniref:rod shape-determining protein MreD n=1 Tax=Dongshaea marina TaxID=2047966 RepID=UPI000D3ED4F0|nr:rod shape-determining protein MreD [Dongshaea marina]
MSSSIKGLLLVYLSFLLALVLAILPLPVQLNPYRPDWLVMVMIYWVMALPHRVGMGTAWISGMLLDVLLGGTLGIRALAMALIAYFTALNSQQIRNFSLWQQAIIVGGLSLLGKLVVFWAEHLSSEVTIHTRFFWSVIPTMIIWPWLFLLLRKLRRQFRIK